MKSEHMPFVFDDGGRVDAGFKGHAGDCVCRAVTIASGRPYGEVYARLAAGMGSQRRSKHAPKKTASARSGVSVQRKWFKEYMAELGFVWVPTMKIGTGCRVHLVAGELPEGRLVVAVSRHYTAVVDGVIRDTHDPQRTTYWYDREGNTSSVSERCVYGYWILKGR